MAAAVVFEAAELLRAAGMKRDETGLLSGFCLKKPYRGNRDVFLNMFSVSISVRLLEDFKEGFSFGVPRD